MQKDKLMILAGALVRGFLFFGVVMGLAMGCVSLNAKWSPDLVWFPVPVIAALVGAIWWAQRRWDIGLGRPASTDGPRGGAYFGRVYAVGIALTLFGIAVCIVHGSFTGMVRDTEVFSTEVSPLFAMTYAIFMSVVAAILAEATFRGIVQSRVQTVYSVWPTVIIISAINVIAHRWGPEIVNNWLGLFTTLAAWGYLRWLSQSLWPPLVLHTLVNFIVATGLWFRGPFDHALLSGAAVIGFAVFGLVALGVAVSLVRAGNWDFRRMGPESMSTGGDNDVRQTARTGSRFAS